MFILENMLWLLVLIGVMILIHELGHFWAARYFDVKVEVFSFGFGPRLFGFRKGETDYRFSAILFGGYVKMAGEQPADQDDPRGFMTKPRWQRLIVIAAGPFMNIVLAVGLLTGLYMVKHEKVAEPPVRGMVGHVTPDSPAAKAGVREGDRIIAIDGQQNPSWEDIVLKEVAGAYKPLDITVERGGRHIKLSVTPTLDERSGVGSAGWSEKGEIQLGNLSPNMPAQKAGLQKGDLVLRANGQPVHSVIKFHEVVRGSEGRPVEIEVERIGRRVPFEVQPVFTSAGEGPERWMIGAMVEQKLKLETEQLSFFDALQESVNQNLRGASLIFQFLRGIVERRMSAKSVSGPIGIAQLSGEAAREGPTAFILLMSMVSLNLAIFNMLPIPILDGGAILLLLVEMVMRRDLSLTVKEAVFKVGLVFIMMLVVFVIYNDISKIVPAG